MRLLAIVLSLFGGALSCERAPRVTAEESVRRDIAQRLGLGVMTSNFPSNLIFEVDTSRAVQGLRYVRGSYSGGADMQFFEDVIDFDGRVTPVREIADWVAVMEDAGWRPVDPENVVTACGELVRHVVLRAGPDRGATIYRDSSSLADPRETGIDDPIRSVVQRAVQSPEATMDAAGNWTVRLWILYGPWSARYLCSFSGGRRPLRVNVAVVDSLSRYWR